MIHQSAKFVSLRGRINTANHTRHQHALFLSISIKIIISFRMGIILSRFRIFLPILLITILKVIHVTSGILILCVYFLTLLRFSLVDQFANIFHYKLAFSKFSRRYHTTAFTRKVSDLQINCHNLLNLLET